MSAYSDWKAGALTDDEYRQAVKDEEWLDKTRAARISAERCYPGDAVDVWEDEDE